jgi:hypothetical protein
LKLRKYFEEGSLMIPAEVVWASLDKGKRQRAIRMLQDGALQAEGRILIEDDNLHPNEEQVARIASISREEWKSCNAAPWLENYESENGLYVLNTDTCQKNVNIEITNSVALRDLVELQIDQMSVEDFDQALFRAFGTKMGAKAWAAAAAALASSAVNPTASALADFLINQSDLWAQGPPNHRNLMKHLGPFAAEFRKRMGIS